MESRGNPSLTVHSKTSLSASNAFSDFLFVLAFPQEISDSAIHHLLLQARLALSLNSDQSRSGFP
jgi:hypothetical protein